MPEYEDKYPFVPSLVVKFRKHLSKETLIEVNESIIASAMPENDDSDDDNNSNNSDEKNARKDYLSLEKCKQRTANVSTMLLSSSFNMCIMI